MLLGHVCSKYLKEMPGNAGFNGLLTTMLCQLGVAPHFFQLVKCTRIALHHMDDYIIVIYDNPLRSLLAFMAERRFPAFILHLHLDVIADGFYLGSTGGLAY